MFILSIDLALTFFKFFITINPMKLIDGCCMSDNVHTLQYLKKGIV